MKQLKKTLLTLVALIALTTGAWADEATITLKCGTTEKTYDNVTLPWSTTADILKEVVTDLDFNVNINSISGGDGKVVKDGNENFAVTGTFSGEATVTVTYNTGSSATITVTAPGPAGPTVDWNNQTWSGWAESETTHTVGDITITCSGNAKAYESTGSGEPLAMEAGNNDAITFTSNGAPFASISISTADELNVAGWPYNSSTWSYEWSGEPTTSVTLSGCDIKADEIKFTFASSASAVTVDWNKTSKTGTFSMPAGNVTVSVDYFPKATADGAVTAATDVKATTDAPLVTVDATQLTGAAKLMYYASTDATAPAYDAEGWTDQVPTAEKFTEAGSVNVWYYPVGTDEGVGGATATYSDGDMNATALAVTLGAAPTYSVTFAEGIPEADKWTASPNTDVTKGETVTVTYTGKVIGVKAEKKAESTLAAALKDGAIVTITYGWGSYTTIFTYTNNGGTFSCNITGSWAGEFKSSSTLNDKSFTLSGWNEDMVGETKFSITFNAEDGTYVFNEKGSEARSFNFSLNGVDITDQLTEEK